MGLMPHLALFFFALGDIFLNSDKMGNHTVLIFYRRNPRHFPKEFSIFVFIEYFTFPYLTAFQSVPHIFIGCWVSLSRLPNIWVFSNNLIRLIAGQSSKA